MANVELERPKELSSFRKIAIGTWRTAYDPSVYGTMVLDMEPAMAYLARFRASTGKRLTVSHMMAKAVAAALERVPEANVILRFNKPYRRKRVAVFFQVAMTEGSGPEEKVDLSGATLYDVDRKSLLELIEEFEDKVTAVRERKDPNLEKTRSGMRWVPALMMNWILRVISFFGYTLNLRMGWAGLPPDPFGSVMITNVGSLGLDTAYVPLVPFSRVPILLALGEVKEAAVVVDGKVEIRKQLSVNATFDHRIIDGHHAAVMSKVLRSWFAEPDAHFGAIPERPAASSSEAPAPAA